eukprot:4220477-Amphidinium_carterae.2
MQSNTALMGFPHCQLQQCKTCPTIVRFTKPHWGSKFGRVWRLPRAAAASDGRHEEETIKGNLKSFNQ